MDMRVYVILQGKKDNSGDPFGSIARSLKRMVNSIYGTTTSAGAMSAQLDAYRALMNSGAQNADGLRAKITINDESPWPKENPSIGIKKESN